MFKGKNTDNFTNDTIKVLQTHADWIESKGKSGERGILDNVNLTNVDFLEHLIFTDGFNKDSFRGVSLKSASFDRSICNGMIFIGADLRRASFWKSKLQGAIFIGAKLNNTSFLSASLSGAKFSGINMNWCDFRKSSAPKVDMSNTSLQNRDFSEVNFYSSNFTHGKLINNNFFKANLSGCDLKNANFLRSNLSYADLSGADITGAALVQVLTEGWKIAGVKCDYIYFDAERKIKIPSGRNFLPGEFEELYAWFPGFIYYFKNQMQALDPYIIAVIVNGLNQSIPELHLQIDSIRGKGLVPQIEFSSRGSVDLEKFENLISDLLDDKISSIHQSLAKNNELSIASINEIIAEHIKDIPMTKLEFNAPVQNVISENHGTVNIQSIGLSNAQKAIEAIENIETKDKLSQTAKEETVKELAKLAAGESFKLTKKSLGWLKNIRSELPTDIAAIINSIVGI